MINLIDIQYVHITAQYSNAVLLAILPHISEFAKKMELSIPLPLTAPQIRAFGCDDHLGETGGAVDLTNDYIFYFEHGHLKEFKGPKSFYRLQDPELVPGFYGQFRMDWREAVEACRATIRKLGYTEEMLFADLEAKVDSPSGIGTNLIPRYRIEWVDPRNGVTSCEFEVDAQEKKIEQLYFLNRN